MGAFQASLDDLDQRFSNKFLLVKNMLEDKDDGSYEEFVSAMKDTNHTGPAIAAALKSSIGIEVTGRTVNDWRKRGHV